MMRSTVGVAILMSLLLSIVAGCARQWEHAPPPAQPIDGGVNVEPRLTLEQSQMRYRVGTPPPPVEQYAPVTPTGEAAPATTPVAPVAPPQPAAPGSARPSFQSWYIDHGEPRVLVLVNREFITDDAEFQADARGVAEVDVRVSGQTTEGQEWFADGASRATAQSERRVANIRNLSSAELRQLEQAFTRPLALERVNLVDPQLITRLQQLEDSERRMPSARGQMDNVETQAYVNHADWVVELLAHRTPPGDPQEFSVRARVIDLQSGRVLVSLISDPLVAPIYIPGTRGIPPRVPLGESARAVAGALISELPLAAP